MTLKEASRDYYVELFYDDGGWIWVVDCGYYQYGDDVGCPIEEAQRRLTAFLNDFKGPEKQFSRDLPTPFELFGIEVDKGWWPLVEPIYDRIQELNAKGARIEISQIKEKFGMLCFYVQNAPEEIIDMIREAEARSVHVCQHCGKPARRVEDKYSWIHTLCPECLKEKIEDRIRKAGK